jgi:hypothetical protein
LMRRISSTCASSASPRSPRWDTPGVVDRGCPRAADVDVVRATISRTPAPSAMSARTRAPGRPRLDLPDDGVGRLARFAVMFTATAAPGRGQPDADGRPEGRARRR